MNWSESRIKFLRQEINKLAIAYYENDKPIVSDLEYDALFLELTNLEEANPELITPDSPTQKVGGKVDRRFEKVNHEFQMLSLGNAFNTDDLKKFEDQIAKVVSKQSIKYVTELKIDGLSISLLYRKGKLFQAITRGTGLVGEDVTHNILTIKDIPKIIPFENSIEFRGEIYMSNIVFEKLNAKGEKLANPRNGAAGSIRQLDSKVAERRELSSFIYSIPNPLDYDLNTHEDVLKFIKAQGFQTNEFARINSSVDEIEKSINYYIDIRKSLPYEIDGVVIKVNDITAWEDIGYTVKAPKFMIAYKFPEEVAQTQLLKIFPTIGRTGRVTYNAKLAPVRLAGSVVTAATLHNADYIRELNINEGDIVKVKKAGEIIPKVLGVIEKLNEDVWVEQKNCPGCLHEFVRSPGEVDQYCVNLECPQRNIASLEHFTSRNAMDIRDLSIKTIELFVQEGLITDLPSIFGLVNKKDQMLQLWGFKEKSVNNIIEAIEKSKQCDLGRFLFAIGIRHLGEKNAQTLAKRFGSLENISKATFEELSQVRDFGEKVAQSVSEYFADAANRKMLDEFLEFNLKFNELKKPVSDKFAGKNFVITGTLSKGREVFKALIESNGGNVSSAVSRNTSYLLAGEEAGSKLEKAKEFSISILSEVEFNKLLGDQDE